MKDGIGFLFLGLAVVFAALVVAGVLGYVPDDTHEYTGTVVSVTGVPAGINRTTLFIEFSDGRILKCRDRWDKPFVFQTGKPTVVRVDGSGMLLEVRDVAAEKE